MSWGGKWYVGVILLYKKTVGGVEDLFISICPDGVITHWHLGMSMSGAENKSATIALKKCSNLIWSNFTEQIGHRAPKFAIGRLFEIGIRL